MAEDNSLRQARIEKLQKLKELGINPYPASTNRTHTIAQALGLEGQTVAITGRMMSYREHGNIAFADLQDESGKMQVFFQKKLLGESFKNLRLLDLGDFIQVEGEVGKTIAGEISVIPTNWQLVTKSLLPIPSEHFGLKDEEIRLRKRYLDLLMHPELRELFHKKTIFWQAMRDFLVKKGFLEVETPVLQPIPGGADARPFVTHHFAQDMELYLRISLELPLKRLLVGGFEKVFEIGRIFRNEGIDAEHLQDYTQLEFYWAYANYNELMDFVQEMYQSVIQMTFGTLKTKWQGHEIDWSGNWERKDYTKLLNEHWGVETEKMSIEDLYKLAEKLGVKVEPNLGKGRLLDYIYKKTIRPKLIQPMFVINHPVEVEPLAKRLESDFNKVQRMQILAMGSELGKGFSELNDPLDQRERFEEQMRLREAGDEEAQMMDQDFVEALEYGMPPAAGFGISERLFAMLVDKPVREMVFFPTMKTEKSPAETITKLHRPDIFSLSPEIKEKYPSITIGTAIIKGVHIEKENPELEKEKAAIIKSLEGLTTEQIGEFPEIKSYRKLYKEMGVDWHSRRPSPEALLKRIASGKGLYTINTAVDAYNLVVLKTHVSAGAFDYDQIKFPTNLQIAKGGENILLLGDGEITELNPGEIAYFDSDGPFNLDFNYRDAQRTSVQEHSNNLYVNVDGVYDIGPEEVEKVLREVVDAIMKYCGGTLETFGVVTTNDKDEQHNLSSTKSSHSGSNSFPTSDVSQVNMTRNEAFELLQKYMQTPNLIKHSLAAEAAMKGIYRYLHKDDYDQKAEEVWGITGVLHDVDYEVAQKEDKLDQHGRLLFDRDPNLVEEPIQHAIKAHNYTKTGTNPETDMDWAIATVDQLTGLVVSSTLISKERKLSGIDPQFVLKRFNTPGFSKGVDRENIKLCETKLGIPLLEFIQITLESMQQISDQMGL